MVDEDELTKFDVNKIESEVLQYTLDRIEKLETENTRFRNALTKIKNMRRIPVTSEIADRALKGEDD